MSTDIQTPVSKAALVAGWILTVLVGAFMLFDAGMKLVKPDFVVKATVELGFPEESIVPMGASLLASTLLYLFPRTAVLGAILMTGYLGGAVATHVHAGHGPFEVLFPVAFGVVAWLGLYLRDRRLRALAPIRS